MRNFIFAAVRKTRMHGYKHLATIKRMVAAATVNVPKATQL